jgi:predicted short-subunit dehydrogenase-like oxidoreductase (DUF2520 family)
VFASNFTTQSLHISREILQKEQLPFKLLEPLVKETIAKCFEIGPEEALTGPAKRRDEKVLQLHEDLLENDPMWRAVYHYMTKSILHAGKQS